MYSFVPRLNLYIDVCTCFALFYTFTSGRLCTYRAMCFFFVRFVCTSKDVIDARVFANNPKKTNEQQQKTETKERPQRKTASNNSQIFSGIACNANIPYVYAHRTDMKHSIWLLLFSSLFICVLYVYLCTWIYIFCYACLYTHTEIEIGAREPLKKPTSIHGVVHVI